MTIIDRLATAAQAMALALTVIAALLVGSAGAARAQSPAPCVGVGCCCNPQAGGNWPDCAAGFECRRQVGPPHAQVCVVKGANPATVLQLRSSQPPACRMALTPLAPAASPTGCQGAGCCCNQQQGGSWPDCARGFECRRQVGPPHAQICVEKGANPATVLQLRSSEPSSCSVHVTLMGVWTVTPYFIVNSRECGQVEYSGRLTINQRIGAEHFRGTNTFTWDMRRANRQCEFKFPPSGTVTIDLHLRGNNVTIKYLNTGANTFVDDHLILAGRTMSGTDNVGQRIVYTRQSP